MTPCRVCRGRHPVRAGPGDRYPGMVKTFDALFDELAAKGAARPAGSGTVAELEADEARLRQLAGGGNEERKKQ